jgi:hypothetical protein
MLIRFPFVNQVVGVARPMRTVNLNHVADAEWMEILERDEHEFPEATVTRFRESTVVTRWHDGTHWKILGSRADVAAKPTLLHAALPPESVLAVPQKGIAPLDDQTTVRNVAADYRDDIVSAVRDAVANDFAVLGDKVFARCEEPYFVVRESGGSVEVKLNELRFLRDREFPVGALFRADERRAMHVAVRDALARGLRNTNAGRMPIWSVPEVSVLLPQSITFRAERAQVVHLARVAAAHVPGVLQRLTYDQLEAYADLRDLLEDTDISDDDAVVDAIADLVPVIEHVLPLWAGVSAKATSERWHFRPINAETPRPATRLGG